MKQIYLAADMNKEEITDASEKDKEVILSALTEEDDPNPLDWTGWCDLARNIGMEVICLIAAMVILIIVAFPIYLVYKKMNENSLEEKND